MKQAIGVFAALLASGEAGKSGEHPIEKIINLLKGLESQAVEEGKSEALSFQKFEYWCKNSKKTLTKAIAEEKDNIDSLESKIAAKTEESKGLGENIAKLEAELGKMSTSAKEALSASDKANTLYEQVSSDLESTIESVGECVTAIKDSKDDTSFLAAQQKVSKVIAMLEVVKTDPAEVAAAGDMAAHKKSYSFKGGNILELLKQLELKFEDDLTQVEKEETNRVNSYNLAKDARDNAITAAEKSKTEKTDLKAEVDEEKSEAEGDLEDEEGELEADSGTLETTDKKCSVKTSEWEERSATRSGEIEAINVAIKILAKVADVRTEAPSNPVPPASPVAFLQIVDVNSDPKMKAVVYLRQKAAQLHAKGLERLAQEVQAHLGSPFDLINNDIQKMIFRLMAEQKDEDEHKHWCDLELEKTQVSIDDKQDKMDDLEVKINDAEAYIGELTEEIKAADEMVAEIVAFMKEATEIREVGKKENDLAIKDSKDSQEAVSNAIAVLTDFYKESGQIAKEPWEFIQQKGVELPDDPETWDSSYTAVSDPSAQPGGIITILEKCNEEFATMEADTKAQEASDQDAYDSDMQEHDIEKAKRSKESDMKGAEKKRLVSKTASMAKNRKHVADEHEATVQYQKDLQPACVEGDSTYEDRKAARTDEIEALHNSQVILEEAFKNMEKADGFLQKKISKH